MDSTVVRMLRDAHGRVTEVGGSADGRAVRWVRRALRDEHGEGAARSPLRVAGGKRTRAADDGRRPARAWTGWQRARVRAAGYTAMRAAFARAVAGVQTDGHDWRPPVARDDVQAAERPMVGREADDEVVAEHAEPEPAEGDALHDEMAEWAAAEAAAPAEEVQPWEEDMENEMLENDLWAGVREPFGDG